jgi:hypothetical protein
MIGLVRSEFTTVAVPTGQVTTQNLTSGFRSNTPGYPTTDMDTSHAVLTMRVHQHDPPQTVAAGDFAFADCTSTPFSGLSNTHQFYDRGSQFNPTDESGILLEPPAVAGTYNFRLPQVDADGNDIGGVRSPTLQAPLATYTSWNTRAAGYSEGDACDLTGNTIPFAPTKAARLSNGDPRLSLEERYGSHDGYVATVKAAAARLSREGLLLLEVAATVVQQAQDGTVVNSANDGAITQTMMPRWFMATSSECRWAGQGVILQEYPDQRWQKAARHPATNADAG